MKSFGKFEALLTQLVSIWIEDIIILRSTNRRKNSVALSCHGGAMSMAAYLKDVNPLLISFKAIWWKHFMTSTTSLSTSTTFYFSPKTISRIMSNVSLKYSNVSDPKICMSMLNKHSSLPHLSTILIYPYYGRYQAATQEDYFNSCFCSPYDPKTTPQIPWLCQLYRQLWYHRSATIAPLTQLTGSNSKWKWTDQHEQASKM